jgi:predicted metalloprotease with PDZ domain
MTKLNKNRRRKTVFLFVLFAFCVSAILAQNSIKLTIDASEAARNVLHVRETMPVKAGQMTLFYPKWIPGEHAPTGTLNDMVNLFVTANGKPLEWRRDDVEMFAFHLTVPANVKQIEIAFDDVSQPATIASAQLSRIKWNRLLLYPQGAKSDDIQVVGSLKMPNDWKYATALPVARETKNAVDFKSVNLTTFVDSPAVVGKNFKRVPLGENGGAIHEIDIFADTPEALEYKPETLEGWKNLVREMNLAFGAHHYGSYKFLLTLSDVGGSEGLEHHESSEDGVGLKGLSDEYELLDLGDLLGHEYTHSWNGKYRRPASLTTPDFEKPQYGELLWVYEGLTQYLGRVFPTRARLWTPEVFRDVIADTAANMDNQTGRRWRPLVDTARAVQFTYGSPSAWRNERRRVDYYYEGSLIWLEADVLIRQRSKGKLSLDDFFKKFHGGGQNTAPEVVTYDFETVARTLNEVLPYDWRAFLNDRVYKIQTRAPLGGITNGGWRLVYNDTPNVQMQIDEHSRNFTNLMYSIGILVDKDGAISDINPDFAAAKSGLAPGMKITKINGADFSAESFHKAIGEAKKTSSIELVVENGNSTETYKLNYKGGERYPHLERDATKPDLLSEIVKSH